MSFDGEQGEVVGIIGKKGAGSQRSLKILLRIIATTKVTVNLHGPVGSLLEAGTGYLLKKDMMLACHKHTNENTRSIFT